MLNMPPKILIIPARRHIIEAYCEYIIRYLSNEFYFEMGYPPYPPYDNIKERVWNNETSPLNKNPDDFDLIYPQWMDHTYLEPKEKYYPKIASVFLEPGQPQYQVAVRGATSPVCERALEGNYHSLRFGVDTDLFQPYPMVRKDDLLHVGFIGNIQTPRRYIKDLFIEALKDVEGIRLMVFPTTWPPHTRQDEIELMGGQALIDSVVDGDKWFTGLPNLYNQMDVFVRVDVDAGYQFSINEAAACGVPVVCTDSGNTKQICDAGGGICVGNPEGNWAPENLAIYAKKIREAVIFMRDNPAKRQQMGINAREEIMRNWRWDYFIPYWREFFKEGIKNAM